VLEALEGVIASRKADPSARSYTTKLLASGPEGAGAKVTVSGLDEKAARTAGGDGGSR